MKAKNCSCDYMLFNAQGMDPTKKEGGVAVVLWTRMLHQSQQPGIKKQKNEDVTKKVRDKINLLRQQISKIAVLYLFRLSIVSHFCVAVGEISRLYYYNYTMNQGLYSYLVHPVVQTRVTLIVGSHGCDVVDQPIDCAYPAWSKHDLARYSYTKCNLSNLNIFTDQLKKLLELKKILQKRHDKGPPKNGNVL